MKYLKTQFTEDEFDQIMQYGIFDIAYESHDLIMDHIRQTENNRGRNK